MGGPSRRTLLGVWPRALAPRVVWGAAWPLVVACSSAADVPTATDEACAPGQSIACVGPEGCTGYQICRLDGGQGYDPCLCGTRSRDAETLDRDAYALDVTVDDTGYDTTVADTGLDGLYGDAPLDATIDATVVDALADAGPAGDVSTDAEVDTASDAVLDAAFDAAMADVAVDSSPDEAGVPVDSTAVDTLSDAGSFPGDAPTDAEVDGGLDGAPDATTMDVAVDSSPDGPPSDAEADAGCDAPFPASPVLSSDITISGTIGGGPLPAGGRLRIQLEETDFVCDQQPATPGCGPAVGSYPYLEYTLVGPTLPAPYSLVAPPRQIVCPETFGGRYFAIQLFHADSAGNISGSPQVQQCGSINQSGTFTPSGTATMSGASITLRRNLSVTTALPIADAADSSARSAGVRPPTSCCTQVQ
jgi:hypothetical protein